MSFGNFISALIDQGVGAAGAYTTGLDAGRERKKAEALAALERQRQERADALREQLASGEMALNTEQLTAAHRTNEDAATHHGEHEVQGRWFPNTDEGYRQSKMWGESIVEGNARAARRGAPPVGGGGGGGESRRHAALSSMINTAIAAAHGDANTALRMLHGIPGGTAARTSGAITIPMMLAAADQYAASAGAARTARADEHAPVNGIPREDWAAHVDATYTMEPTTEIQMAAHAALLEGHTKEEILAQASRAFHAGQISAAEIGQLTHYLNPSSDE